MNAEQRQAARERCEKAIPGPWETYGDRYATWLIHKTGGWVFACVTDVKKNPADGQDNPEHDPTGQRAANTAAFIAHARTDLPAALDALDAKDAEIERLRVALTKIADYEETSWHNEPVEAAIACGLAQMAREALEHGESK